MSRNEECFPPRAIRSILKLRKIHGANCELIRTRRVRNEDAPTEIRTRVTTVLLYNLTEDKTLLEDCSCPRVGEIFYLIE